MPLSTVDRTKTKRFTDGAAWVELRTQLTKHDQDVVQDLNSHYRLPADLLAGVSVNGEGVDGAPAIEVRTNATQINRTLFELLCVDWSLDEEPTAAAYDTLTQESGEWIDKCVTQALAEGRGRVEGKARSSKRRKPSPSTSPTAEESSGTDSPPTSDD